MSSSEFRMITDLQAVTPKSLDFNFEELKQFLAENLKLYKGLVVTEDSIRDAKAIKAKINNVATAIKDQRIAIKKEYEVPYLAFKAQCDELEGMCKEVTEAIGSQLNIFEEKRKSAKKELFEMYFKEKSTDESKRFLTFEDVFNEKWLNVTFNDADAYSLIDEKIEETISAVEAIRNLNSDYTVTLLEHYKQTHNLMACINKNKELMEIAKAEKTDEPPVEVEDAQAVKAVKTKAEGLKEKTITVAFKVTCTESQLAKLKEFLIENNIKYGKA